MLFRSELAQAREHYQTALALDPTNRIAERNIDRLKILIQDQKIEKTDAAKEGSKAPVSIFVEETGKTGFAYLTDLAGPRQLAQVNPGDAVELTPEGNRLVASSNGVRIGFVEPRVAARAVASFAGADRATATRRLAGHLARRGFPAGVVSRVVRTTLEGWGKGAPVDHDPTEDDELPGAG